MKRILVVDDEKSVRDFIKNCLARHGFDVTAAESGDEAERTFRTQPFDLLITDLYMPGKEGIETITSIRRDDPDVKIIAISGGGRGGSFDMLQIAQRLGASICLAKPMTHEELVETVVSLIGDP